MHRVSIAEASANLEALIEEVAKGEEVIITKGRNEAFKIVREPEAGPTPRFGSARGLIRMSSDFDEPLADFEGYAP